MGKDRFEVNITIEGCSHQATFRKNGKIVFREDLTSQDKDKLAQSITFIHGYLAEENEPIIQLR